MFLYYGIHVSESVSRWNKQSLNQTAVRNRQIKYWRKKVFLFVLNLYCTYAVNQFTVIQVFNKVFLFRGHLGISVYVCTLKISYFMTLKKTQESKFSWLTMQIPSALAEYSIWLCALCVKSHLELLVGIHGLGLEFHDLVGLVRVFLY